jgi:DNA-binding GntR family transcriptional regulator
LAISSSQNSSLSALEILRTKSLTSVVQEEIERMIWDEELEPNDRINEVTLAQRFGVSRGPVREACHALAAVGLLDITPSRGFSVRSLSAQEVAEMYEARAGLCGYMGMLLAERLTDSNLERLDVMVEKMDKAASAGDVERYYRLNLEFHHGLFSMTGNARLTQIYDGVVRELHLCRVKALSQAGALKASNSEHRTIVETLAKRDPEQSFTVLSDHVKASHGRILAAMDKPA